jgi:hypothetical protein
LNKQKSSEKKKRKVVENEDAAENFYRQVVLKQIPMRKWQGVLHSLESERV